MGRLVHFEIHADDCDRAERFYTRVFGWTVQRYEGSVDYRLVMTGPRSEIGIDGAITERRGPRPADGSAVSAFVCTVSVDDLDSTGARIGEEGGRRVTEPSDIPGVGRLAYFRDTEGNILGALQPAPRTAHAAGGAGEQAGAT